MKITPSRSGKSEFLAVYKEVMGSVVVTSRMDPARLYNLRCSQIPYCPRSVLLNYGARGLHQSMPMLMSFYVGVGTAVHETMQRYLSQSGRFLADYHCKECGKKYPLSHKIECCGFPTQYEELGLNFKGIVGHIDGVFRDSKGNFWIIDFKTCSVAGSEAKEKNPGDGYKYQVRAYAWLLKKQYGVTVKGVMLIFIPRDNPMNPTVWEELFTERNFKDAAEMLKAERAKHRATMTASRLEDFRALFKHKCGSPYCEPCKKDMPTLLKTASKMLAFGKFPIKKD